MRIKKPTKELFIETTHKWKALCLLDGGERIEKMNEINE